MTISFQSENVIKTHFLMVETKKYSTFVLHFFKW